MTKLLIATTIPATLRAFLLPYSDHFRALGWRVDCLSCGVSRDEICAAHFDKCFDIDWSRNPFSIANMPCPPQVREIIEREGYDIVHVHTPVAAFVTRFALRNIRKKIGAKIVYTAHGFHFHKRGGKIKNFIFRSMEKIAARWTDKIIVMNDDDFEAARTFYPSEAVVKMNGIGLDLNYYSRKSTTGTSPLKLNADEKFFLYIAEFNSGKRHADLIKALRLIDDKKYHIAFAGTGPLMDEMKKIAAELGVAENVHFLGFVPDVRPLIASATALLMPSEREGLPRSVMEAMALETLVIGADIRGTRDLLGEGCGILTPVGDIEALARAMRFCLTDTEEIKQRALKKIQNYGIDALIKEHEKIYV